MFLGKFFKVSSSFCRVTIRITKICWSNTLNMALNLTFPSILSREVIGFRPFKTLKTLLS
jgi:hypothetical protein